MTISDITPRIAEKDAAAQPAVVVYGRTECVQCDRTTKLMDREHIPYTYVNVDHDETAANYVRTAFEKTQLPAVEVHQGDSLSQWQGFNPALIMALRAAA
ncbi:glutaredoxin family protein [Citricoccus nitrophenolicus]|uniref:Glutaredoxin family protein n=1 Tax=Citricoccus nitrophenolicus TaxID=863575 RepID=A0ABV0IE42_9MICC